MMQKFTEFRPKYTLLWNSMYVITLAFDTADKAIFKDCASVVLDQFSFLQDLFENQEKYPVNCEWLSFKQKIDKSF